MPLFFALCNFALFNKHGTVSAGQNTPISRDHKSPAFWQIWSCTTSIPTSPSTSLKSDCREAWGDRRSFSWRRAPSSICLWSVKGDKIRVKILLWMISQLAFRNLSRIAWAYGARGDLGDVRIEGEEVKGLAHKRMQFMWALHCLNCRDVGRKEGQKPV